MFGLIVKISLVLGISIVGLIVSLIVFAIISENRKKLYRISITNNPQKITFNNVVNLKAEGFDVNNNKVEINDLKWLVTEGGKVDNKGKFTAGFAEKIVNITASSGKIKAEITIDIIKPKLQVFGISYDKSYNILLGVKIPLKINSKDQLGYYLPIKNITWSSHEDYFIDSQNNLTFKPSAKGEYTITATVNDCNKTASINLNIPSILTNLYISPNNLSLKPNQPYQFIVTAFDQSQEKMSTEGIKWSCDDGGFITDNGIFTANLQQKSAVITATLKGVKTSVTVDILPVLNQIIITPNSPIIEPHQSIQFKAEGFDQFNQYFPLTSVEWYADQGRINDDGYYQGLDYETEVKITAKSGDNSTSISCLILEPSRLTKIAIIPEYISIQLGENHRFKVIGFNQRNERISVNNIDWNVDEGFISDSGLYSPNDNQQGNYYITAQL